MRHPVGLTAVQKNKNADASTRTATKKQRYESCMVQNKSPNLAFRETNDVEMCFSYFNKKI